MPTVARFNITPPKSTALHHPERIELSERGAEGDHLFMVVTPGGTRLSGAAKAPCSRSVPNTDAHDLPDPRRYRMLVELAGCEPHEEDAWSGRPVQLGRTIVRVGASVPRCSVTTLDPDTRRPDFPALDVLATYRLQEGQLMFGVYADVERAGTVRIGDPVTPLDD